MYFENADEITENIAWNITLWNGTVLSGTELQKNISIRVDDTTGCTDAGNYNYICEAEIFAWINEAEYTENGVLKCNGTFTGILYVSERPSESNPLLIYEKWVEPSEVSPGESFEIHIRLEGRGFIQQAVNLSAVHIIDVSGSMMNPAILKEYDLNIVPNILRREFNLTNTGDLEIYVYTTDRLTDWYSNEACKVRSGYESNCPWYGKGYDESFIKLYLKSPSDTTPVEVGSDYSQGMAIGKFYSDNDAQPGNYTIEVVARAPESINLTIIVKLNGTTIINETVPYLNYQEISFELPGLTEYVFMAIKDINNAPSWSSAEWSDWTTIEYYSVSGWSRYWEYRERLYGYGTYTDSQLNAWVITPDGSKEFVMKRLYGSTLYGWYYARNNYYVSFYSDFFSPNPNTGTYKLIFVPTTREAVNVEPKIIIKRMDAAKLAALTFNSMLEEGDFVGLTTFTTDADRIPINSSPLLYMTTDKDSVANKINSLKAELATDHAEGLYEGVMVFPIWNEEGNNCTECIANTRPLIILMSDGETTICDKKSYFGCDQCSGRCDGGSWCQSGADQARCIADYKEQYRNK